MKQHLLTCSLYSRGRADSELNSPQNSSVLNEELQSKIADNERLNKELSQVKIESSTTVMQVTMRSSAHGSSSTITVVFVSFPHYLCHTVKLQ